MNNIAIGRADIPQELYVPNWNTISTNKIDIDIGGLIREELEKLNMKPKFTLLSCRNCGGTINQKINDNIVKCPYCESVYFVSKYFINDTGELYETNKC